MRLLEGLKPRTFVMENVSGLVKGKMRLIFAQILRSLRGAGYRVSARLMNAKWYGVPQARERMIFVGVREDLCEEFGVAPSHPSGWGPPITVREALRDLPEDVEPGPNLGDLGYWIWCRAKPLESWGKYHPEGHWFNSATLDPDRPSYTITRTVMGKGAATTARWDEPRCIGIAEVKRLCSFPDEYILTGKFQDQWARLGNAVPPLLSKAVAGHLRTEVLEKTGAVEPDSGAACMDAQDDEACADAQSPATA